MNESSNSPSATLRLREPCLEDGAALHALIRACPPLDVNSAYAYFLLCDHFRQTSVVAEDENGRILGAITAYVRPDDPETLFVWQVASHADARGQGLGKRMLGAVADRPAAAGCTRLQTTIGPTNAASRGLFASWAESRGLSVREESYLEPDHFEAGDGEGAGHEAECLFTIQPLHASAKETRNPFMIVRTLEDARNSERKVQSDNPIIIANPKPSGVYPIRSPHENL